MTVFIRICLFIFGRCQKESQGINYIVFLCDKYGTYKLISVNFLVSLAFCFKSYNSPKLEELFEYLSEIDGTHRWKAIHKAQYRIFFFFSPSGFRPFPARIEASEFEQLQAQAKKDNDPDVSLLSEWWDEQYLDLKKKIDKPIRRSDGHFYRQD